MSSDTEGRERGEESEFITFPFIFFVAQSNVHFKNRENFSINSIQQAIALEAKMGHCVEVLRHRAFFGIKCFYGTFWSMLVLSTDPVHMYIYKHTALCVHIYTHTSNHWDFCLFVACLRILLFAPPSSGQCTFIRSNQGYGG